MLVGHLVAPARHPSPSDRVRTHGGARAHAVASTRMPRPSSRRRPRPLALPRVRPHPSWPRGGPHFENAGGSYACEADDRRAARLLPPDQAPAPPSFAGGRGRRGGDGPGAPSGGPRRSASRSTRWSSGRRPSAHTYVLAHAFERDARARRRGGRHPAGPRGQRRCGPSGRHVAPAPPSASGRSTPRPGLLDHGRRSTTWSPSAPGWSACPTCRTSSASRTTSRPCRPGDTSGRRVDCSSTGCRARPHGLPDLDALGCDIYVFSLYKVFSVHQGLHGAARRPGPVAPEPGPLLQRRRRAQAPQPGRARPRPGGGVGRRARLHRRRSPTTTMSARPTCRELWRAHEDRLLQPVLDQLSAVAIGCGCSGRRRTTTATGAPRSRSSPLDRTPAEAVAVLRSHRIMAGTGHFYSWRTLEAMGVDPDRRRRAGVVRPLHRPTTRSPSSRTALAELV